MRQTTLPAISIFVSPIDYFSQRTGQSARIRTKQLVVPTRSDALRLPPLDSRASRRRFARRSMLINPADTAVFGQIALVVVASIGSLTAIGVAAHAYVERTNRKMQQVMNPHGIAPSDERLQRLEQAVESIAIEVERISEGQRFLTKLQTEQRAEGRVLGP